MDPSQGAPRCPICKAPLDPAAPGAHRPFCSERCRWLDLSRWLAGEYVIPGEPVQDGPSIDDPELGLGED